MQLSGSQTTMKVKIWDKKAGIFLLLLASSCFSSQVLDQQPSLLHLHHPRLLHPYHQVSSNVLRLAYHQASPSRPSHKPSSPCFSSGPTKKRPGYSLGSLSIDPLGRSHRSAVGQARLQKAIDLTRQVLDIPMDYMIGIVPGGDTGAYEMAMWNLLGDHPVDVLVWDAFGKGWYDDIINQLRLKNVRLFSAPYGSLPPLDEVDYDNDVCFCWNGTTSGVCMPKDGVTIPETRKGLTLCDATSAAFSMRLPWEKLDATTFSWQKALGGEGAHGILILSPKAIARLESCQALKDRPIPKLFRLVDEEKGQVIQSLFKGSTINTPSMLCVEDYCDALEWVIREGGQEKMNARSQANLQAIEAFVEKTSWISFLAKDANIRSPTSVCLELELEKKQLTALTRLLEEDGVAYDIASYRDASPGLRIWCGATIETSDVECLMDWMEWGYAQVSSIR